MINDPIISFDQDWAPDFVCRRVADLLVEKNVKSTWFITHESPFLQYLRANKDLFELAIHPNFLDCSSHGESVADVIHNVYKLVPEAEGTRSHGVMQSGFILSELKRLGNIRYDATSFMPHTSNLTTSEIFTTHGIFSRVPVFWADDHEFLRGEKAVWRYSYFDGWNGIKVFSFHPIHVYLNSSNQNLYLKLKAAVPDIQRGSTSEVDQFIQEGNGSFSMLSSVINSLAERRSFFIKDLLGNTP
jgi:hypothetical protein